MIRPGHPSNPATCLPSPIRALYPALLPVFALILFLLLAGSATAAAPDDDDDNGSRTEEAKDRLDGIGGNVVVQAARVMWYVGIDVMPEFFYFRPVHRDEPPLRYNRYPYRHPEYRGIRIFDPEEGRRGLWHAQGTFSLPQTTRAMQQASVQLKRNIRYWSLIAGYEYLKEDAAPYPIHQGELLLERKFRFVQQGDGGLQFGLRTLQLDGTYYPGPDIGVNLEVYPWRPFSIGYKGSWTYTRFADVINHQLDFGIHIESSRVFFRYRWLDIGGVKFDTFTAGAGFYF